MRVLVLVAIAAASGAATAVAENPRHAGRKSPDDMICREISVIGSRLKYKRVCMTRLQWDEQRRDARDAIDRAQMQQINPRG